MEVKGVKLEIGYGGRIVVPEFDITLHRGEITTIIGLTAAVNQLL